jgi:hypothetical protein
MFKIVSGNCVGRASGLSSVGVPARRIMKNRSPASSNPARKPFPHNAVEKTRRETQDLPDAPVADPTA